MGAIATLAIAAPASAMAPKVKKNKDDVQVKKQLPKHLRKFKTPFKSMKNKKMIRKAAKKYGPGKKSLPRFKKSTSAAERTRTIAAIDRTLLKAKADESATASIRDGIRVWEAMTPGQKNEVLTETNAIVAVWPAGVAATAAAVTAAVAVADFVYHVYEDQRDNGGDDDEEETEDEDTSDGGDTGDTGAIRGALSY